MPGPSTTELQRRLEAVESRLRDTTERLIRIEETFALRLETLETGATEQKQAATDNQTRASEQAERIVRLEVECAALRDLVRERERLFEERTRMLEKLSDRGWNLGQAVLVAVGAAVGGGIITLLVQLALRR